MSQMRTCVTFKSTAFNVTEEKDYFINPSIYGDDLAKWLMEELTKRGFNVNSELGQEDFGWYLTFHCGGIEYDFVLGWRPGDENEDGDWFGCVERKAGCVPSMFGARKRGIKPDVTEAIHKVLSESAIVTDIRWRFAKDFSGGREDAWANEPTAI